MKVHLAGCMLLHNRAHAGVCLGTHGTWLVCQCLPWLNRPVNPTRCVHALTRCCMCGHDHLHAAAQAHMLVAPAIQATTACGVLRSPS